MFRLFLIVAVIALFGYVAWLWFDEDSEFGELPEIEATTLEIGEPMAADEPVAGAEPIQVDPVIERPPVDAPMEVTPPESEGRLDSERDAAQNDPLLPPAEEEETSVSEEIPDTGDDQTPEG